MKAIRFSLFRLFVAVAAFAVLCVIWVSYSHHAPLRNAKVGVIRIQGVGTSICIGSESELNTRALWAAKRCVPPVKEIIVKDRKWSNSLTKFLQMSPDIVSVQLHQCSEFDQEFAACLKRSENLIRLEMKNCDISNFKFPENSQLAIIVLDGSNVTDEQLESIGRYNLTVFSANGTQLTDDCVTAIKAAKIPNMSLMATRISSAAIVDLLSSPHTIRIEVTEQQISQDVIRSHRKSSKVIVHANNWLHGRKKERGWSPKFLSHALSVPRNP